MLTFFFGSTPPFRVQFTLVPLHINKFHSQWGCPPKKKSSSPALVHLFVSLLARIVIELEFVDILPLLTGTNV